MSAQTDMLDRIVDIILTTGKHIYDATTESGHDTVYLTDSETSYVAERIRGKVIKYDMDQIISSLQGTCGHDIGTTLNDYYPGHDFDELTDQQLEYIDQNLFLCDDCGWWCEAGEGNENPNGGGDICMDCHEQYESEEEDEDV